MPCKRFCQGYLRRLGVLGVLGGAEDELGVVGGIDTTRC